ncbi:MAG: mannose-1-phosphate guanylyltransferase/mannose-6-phosphate isomerase [Rhodospirillales bacterium]|nr:mannose-1-phosphate guanylyltransferase/mannose-6-phosphate isomerase [Rhodospirillales bacterium]MBO6787748.1 mannose-1-phosphate guanylyltransferase/mannose-6-phosphate isomerase [Rhodospirillales bacterium]
MTRDPQIVPVILSGGAGQRLWPLSRQQYPKQFLKLNGEESMLQDTLRRLGGDDFSAALFVCNDEHRFLVAEQARAIGHRPRAIVLEPDGRNTAPAAALAALILAADDPDTLMLLAPSDHVIENTDAFLDAVDAAVPAAAEGRFVTFGIRPDRAATGYGYIKAGAPLPDAPACETISHFAEKPDRATAERYLAEGGYFWNSGIFLFRAGAYLDALGALRPDILEACRASVAAGRNDIDFFRPDPDAFAACPSQSIDYAVMEHTDLGAIVPVDMGWNDLGSWDALWHIGERDADGNVTSGDVITQGASNSYLHSSGPLLAAVGIEDVLLIATPDAVLAVARDQVDAVKDVVSTLKTSGRTEHLHHDRVHRPWGWYQSLDLGERFQVKHLMVKPGAGLSLQSHQHRAEHWVVVSGTARVTRGEEVLTLCENQSTYLPAGTIHSLENPGDAPLRVIEVQTGNYLGEDDIVRYEDRYGRT